MSDTRTKLDTQDEEAPFRSSPSEASKAQARRLLEKAKPLPVNRSFDLES